MTTTPKPDGQTEKARVGALAPWYGGKRTLAPRIIEELGEHAAYWEPFCGSMAVLLAKPQATVEAVNDLHGDLHNLARVIQDDQLGPQFYRKARRILFHEGLFRDARQVLTAMPKWDGELDVQRALQFLVFSWMDRNGFAGLRPNKRSHNVCVRWGRSGGDPGKRWLNVVRSIPAWRRRLCGVTILRRDGFEILAKIRDEAGTAIYIDPPYLKKSDKYLHDFDDGDHERLATLADRFQKARVVISYYDHERLATLYPADRWHKRDVPIHKGTANATGGRRKGKKYQAPEVLLLNGSSKIETPAVRRPQGMLFEDD